MGFFKNTVIGISWVGGLRVSTRLVTFVRIIILARLLTPIQFGAFGVASLILAFLETITETGINVFLIQEKKDIKYYINDAWAVSILRGIIISLVIICLSPFIANFFNSPDSQKLLLLISLVPFLRGFINPAIIKFQKNLSFDKDFYLNFSIFTFDSLVSIVLATITKDASSFVFGLIAGVLLEIFISFVFIKPIPKISFNLNNIKKIFGQGKWVTLFVIFNYFSENGDDIVVGRILGTSALGTYQMGYKIATLPISEISDVTNKVVFPVYSKIGEDKERLKKAFLKTMAVITVLVLLLGVIIFFLPKEFIIFILGSQWGSIWELLKILVFYGILRAVTGTTASLFLALGKQSYFAAITFARFFGLAITIIPFTNLLGLVGTCFSALTSVLVEFPFIMFFLYLVLFKSKNSNE